MQPTLGLIGKRVLFVNKGSRILIYPDDPHTLLKKKNKWENTKEWYLGSILEVRGFKLKGQLLRFN